MKLQRALFVILILSPLIPTCFVQADVITYWRRDIDTEATVAKNSVSNLLNLSGFSPPPASISNLVPINTIPLTGTANQRSFEFDGSQRMTISDASTAGLLDFEPTESFTIEGWFNSRQLTTQTQVLVEKRNVGGQFNFGYGLYLRGDGRLAFFGQSDLGDSFTLNSFAITGDTWYHFAGVYDNGTANFFLDGALEDSASGLFLSGGTLDNTNSFALGQTAIPGANLNGFNGFLDEVRISNTALTPSQLLNANAIPEPGTFGLTGLAICGLLCRRRR